MEGVCVPEFKVKNQSVPWVWNNGHFVNTLAEKVPVSLVDMAKAWASHSVIQHRGEDHIGICQWKGKLVTI